MTTFIWTTIYNILSITIKELLFRERQKLSSFCKVGTFNGSSGSKGPGCAAMSYVLDWGIKTTLNPIDVIGEFLLVEVEDHVFLLIFLIMLR